MSYVFNNLSARHLAKISLKCRIRSQITFQERKLISRQNFSIWLAPASCQNGTWVPHCGVINISVQGVRHKQDNGMDTIMWLFIKSALIFRYKFFATDSWYRCLDFWSKWCQENWNHSVLWPSRPPLFCHGIKWKFGLFWQGLEIIHIVVNSKYIRKCFALRV